MPADPNNWFLAREHSSHIEIDAYYNEVYVVTTLNFHFDAPKICLFCNTKIQDLLIHKGVIFFQMIRLNICHGLQLGTACWEGRGEVVPTALPLYSTLDWSSLFGCNLHI